SALAIDAAGNLYTTNGNSIEEVLLVPYGNSFRPEQVSTIAGVADSTGSQDGTGTNALFSRPQAVAINQASGILYVADAGNGTVRKITGAVTPAPPSPLPTLSAVSPNSAAQGSDSVAVTLTGSNFLQNSFVQVGTTPIATTFLNSTSLNAVIP